MRGALGLVVLGTAAMMACGGGEAEEAPPVEDASLETSVDASTPDSADAASETTADVADDATDSSLGDSADASDAMDGGDVSDADDAADATDVADALDASDTRDTAFDAGPITTLTVLGLADWQGQLEPVVERDAVAKTDTTLGGLGLLQAYFEGERVTDPNTVVVSSGDAFGATPPLARFGAALADQAAVESLDHLAVDFAAIGHHELDRGVSHLRALKELAAFRFVASNLDGVGAELDATGATKTVAAPYATKVISGITVAFVAVTGSDAPSLLLPGRIGSLVVKEPIAAANAAAVAARAAGAQVVVALAHLGATGFDGTGAPTGPIVDLAQGLNGVDVVLGAHTGATFTRTIGAATVIQPGVRGRSYARARVRVQAGAVIGVDADVVPVVGEITQLFEPGGECPAVACPTEFTCDTTSQACKKTVKAPTAAAATKLTAYRTALATKLDVTIGKTGGTYSGGSVSAYPERKDETPLGDLMADAMLTRYAPLGAQLALTSSSVIESSYPAAYTAPGTLVRYNCSPSVLCDVVYGDVYTAFRSGHSVVLRKVQGSALWSVLEHAVSALPISSTRVPQMAGLRVEIKASAAPGSRVQTVSIVDTAKTCPADTCGTGFTCNTTLSRCVRDVPKTDPTEYVVVTTDVANAGGDGWTSWKEAWPTPSMERLADVFLEYVDTKTLTPVAGNRLLRLP